MALISTANLLALADKIAAQWEILKSGVGLVANQGSPVVPSLQNLASAAVTTVLGLQEYEQETDFLGPFQTALMQANAENVAATILAGSVNALNYHCANRGIEVASAINGLSGFLQYYNGGGGGANFSALLTDSFSDLWFALKSSRLLNVVSGTDQGACFPPYIGPAPYGSNASGMGAFNISGAVFTAGAAVDNTKYSHARLVAVVTSNWNASGLLTVTGTDSTGTAAQTWTGTPSGSPPLALLTQQTISSGAITAQTRTTVTVGSTTGMAVGSVLTVNKNLPDQELVICENVNSGTTFTAVFRVAHPVSATVDGNNSVLLSPTVSGRRCRSISGIAVATTATGQVRIDSVRERVAI